MIRVRLTKKLASILDGVDVSMLNVGEILELPDSSAALLIAEKWAEPIAEPNADPVAELVADLNDEPSNEHVMTYLLLESHGQPDSLN
jgi:hypothetical protein